jgi:hypothetical protein
VGGSKTSRKVRIEKKKYFKYVKVLMYWRIVECFVPNTQQSIAQLEMTRNRVTSLTHHTAPDGRYFSDGLPRNSFSR